MADTIGKIMVFKMFLLMNFMIFMVCDKGLGASPEVVTVAFKIVIVYALALSVFDTFREDLSAETIFVATGRNLVVIALIISTLTKVM